MTTGRSVHRVSASVGYVPQTAPACARSSPRSKTYKEGKNAAAAQKDRDRNIRARPCTVTCLLQTVRSGARVTRQETSSPIDRLFFIHRCRSGRRSRISILEALMRLGIVMKVEKNHKHPLLKLRDELAKASGLGDLSWPCMLIGFSEYCGSE